MAGVGPEASTLAYTDPMSRFVCIWLLTSALTACADPPPELVALEKAMHKIVDTAKPSVACIIISRSEQYEKLGDVPSPDIPGKLGGFNAPRYKAFGGQERRELIKRLDLSDPELVPEAYGSGVVIGENGLVLTNSHVINGARKIFVRLPGAGRGSYADIIAADGRADLAVLRLLSPPADLKAISFGDGGKVRQGDLIFVLANPFAAGSRDGNPSFSFGTISNLRLKSPGPSEESKRAKPLSEYPTLIQTDVRLNLGCSGGALLNLNGELVGLTTSLASQTGGESAAGYAIPIDANAKKMIETLKRGEEIEYGFLGVTVNPDARTNGRGVPIVDVGPGLPAARAGLRTDDIVTSINGNPIREQEDLFLQISAAQAGTEVEIAAIRFGTPMKFKVRLAKARPHSEGLIASTRPPPVFGLRVDYTSTLTSANPVEGVYIREIDSRSPAEKKLKEWAYNSALIIVALDGKPVPTPDDFRREASGKKSITLDIVEATGNSAATLRKVTLP